MNIWFEKLGQNLTFMRQLSKRTQYSLRALYSLARNYGQGPVLIEHLSHEEVIPKKFLEQILLSLKSTGLVASKKGKGGGYVLAKPPEQITIGAVIRSIEGPLAPLPCASETQFRKCEECIDIETCGTRMVMREVRDAIAQILDHTTLAMVCRKVDQARQKQQGPPVLFYQI
jgi:Rrf2 family protein